MDFDDYELTTIKYDGTESKVILKDSSASSFSYNNEWAKWSYDRSKILFSSKRLGGNYSELFSINKDGSGLTRVTNTNSRSEINPSLSPDGKSILFAALDQNSNRQLYVCNTDGSNERQLTNFSHPTRKVGCSRPVWSHDGNTIYFNANKDTTANNIYSVKLDGTNPTRITTNTATSDWGPSISKNGKIVFYSTVNSVPYLFTINSDGTNRTQVTNFYSGDPVWSPDGNYIAFVSNKDKTANSSQGLDIYTIKADGTNLKRITNTIGEKFYIDWK